MSYAPPYMPNSQIFPWSEWCNILPIFAYFLHIFHSTCKINVPCCCVILVLWHRFHVAKTREQMLKWWFVFSSNAYVHVFEFIIYLFWSIFVSNFFQSINFCHPCSLPGHILFSVTWSTFSSVAHWFLNCVYATLVLTWHMLINLQGKLSK